MLWALITFISLPFSTAFAQTPAGKTTNYLQAQGNLTVYAYPASTNDVPLRTADFTLDRHGVNRWNLILINCLFRTNFLANVPRLEPGTVSATKCSSDGIRTFHADMWNPDYLKSPPQFSRANGSPYPENMEPIEAAPWLMFCLPPNLLTNIKGSAPTDSRSTSITNHLPNIFSTLAWPTNHIPCTLDWDMEKSYLCHAQLWKPGHGNIGMGKQGITTVTLPSPYHTGYLGATHQILSEPGSKNDVSAATPITFKQIHYHVKPNPKPNEIVTPTVSVIVIGTITNLQMLKTEH